MIGKAAQPGNPADHFQLSEGPEISTSNSLPFSLDSYWLAGAWTRPSSARHGAGVPPPLRALTGRAASNPTAIHARYTVAKPRLVAAATAFVRRVAGILRGAARRDSDLRSARL